ncbi:dienelactone hydrolase family protein [Gilvimarinus sp. SDUM040013]|uniref:Alpha/beta family hydrolase n=1 Tax=Gilvimarinus gilvus TaxID=3058038 RepID=A0ABU4S2A4_9GAMM|nr:alpha/beta family hydrolase [Gilvimarinus sp. SDUM040013]MDO3385432.1 dienelactone hydrolase family protein [Gilvimarinus sp. SDUM040013]MDX6851307.1 alpha/beta family hydrolase [Gilvimarinus sp. SDUM040013]
MPDLIVSRAESARAALVLAHGSGAPMDSDFMNRVAQAFCQAGVNVYRFEFPYMHERRALGKKRPPNRQPVLIDSWTEALNQVTERESLPVFIGGKSMGARMACILASIEPVAGVVCFGYPFHPQAKPEKTRLEPLQECRCPIFIAQGTRDKLGSSEDLASYVLADSVVIHWLEDGDHGLRPRVSSGLTHEQHIQGAVSAAVGFIDNLL